MNYPLDVRFKTLALMPQVKVSDAAGQLLLYTKQKLTLKNVALKVFADENQQQPIYDITAEEAAGQLTYKVTTPEGGALGALKMTRGLSALWKAHYPILDAVGAEIGLIHEENPWIKVLDALLSQVPGISMFINPAYLVELRGKTVLRILKKAAVMEGYFAVEKKGEISAADEKLLLPAMLRFIMLERMNG